VSSRLNERSDRREQGAGIRERDQLAQPGVVASVRQISLGVLQKPEESALRVLEGRPDRTPSRRSEAGNGHREAFRGHAFGGEVGQAGVHDLASREAERLEARRAEASRIQRTAAAAGLPSVEPWHHGFGATTANPLDRTVETARARLGKAHARRYLGGKHPSRRKIPYDSRIWTQACPDEVQNQARARRVLRSASISHSSKWLSTEPGSPARPARIASSHRGRSGRRFAPADADQRALTQRLVDAGEDARSLRNKAKYLPSANSSSRSWIVYKSLFAKCLRPLHLAGVRSC